MISANINSLKQFVDIRGLWYILGKQNFAKMKKFKKIGLGLSLLIAFLGIGLLVHSKAEAAPPPGGGGGSSGLTSTDLDAATYKPVTSNGVLGGFQATIAGKTVDFIDSDPLDSIYNSKPKQPSSLFCDSSKGITLNDPISSLGNGNPLTASEDVDYKDANGNCQNYTATITFTKQSNGDIIGTVNPGGGGGGSDTSSSCIDDASLSWIICPVMTGLSKSADSVEGFVASQLNFSVHENL